jgi:small subunit ribosomal protein S21
MVGIYLDGVVVTLRLPRLRPTWRSNSDGAITVQVIVRDNNVDQALRVLKRKMQREGVFREMKRRRSYEKPSEKKAREKSDAVRRARKLARKQAIREGLIAAPPKKERVPSKHPQVLPATTSGTRGT